MAVQGQPGNEKYEMGPGQQQQQGYSNAPATGIPFGLEYLSTLEVVRISQIVDALEVVLGWERNNKYSIMNDQEQQFLFAKEKTDCCTRQMCGPGRPFYMGVWTAQEQEVFAMDRPLRCSGPCGCCCLQEMVVSAPPGQVIAVVKEQWKCVCPHLTVEDSQGNIIFDVHGENLCAISCRCDDVVFKIHSHSDGSEIGQLIKKWRGCTECLGFNRFELHFPRDLDVKMKTTLIAATFLIDFMFFEQQRSQ